MALPPAPPPVPPPGAGGPPPGLGAGGPPGGAPPPPPGPDDDADSGDKVVCTITQADDGTYTVYAGDEPDAGGDMSDDDAGALGAGADMAAPQGVHADSDGAALKAVMDILKSNGASGPAGSAEDQFAAGFGGGAGGPPGAGGAGGGP